VVKAIGRYSLSFTAMSKPQEFTIKVKADDPKKEEKPDDKPNFEGSSKLLKDSKEEGEELVGN
jgi:26S proteasome regulatory subunit N1